MNSHNPHTHMVEVVTVPENSGSRTALFLPASEQFVQEIKIRLFIQQLLNSDSLTGSHGEEISIYHVKNKINTTAGQWWDTFLIPALRRQRLLDL